MKPHWRPIHQEVADTETLQTDVMRFFAILGLCLAAIFSLVQSAALDETRRQPPPESERTAEPVPEVELVAPVVKPVVTAPPEPEIEPETVAEPPSKPAPAPPVPERGFTLEFASTAALDALVKEGRVRLYARTGTRFWQADRRGNFSPASSPPHYYQMQPDTVPLKLRSSLDLVTEHSPEWGVTLPAATAQQIRDFTDRHRGGDLVIDERGKVRLE